LHTGPPAPLPSRPGPVTGAYRSALRGRELVLAGFLALLLVFVGVSLSVGSYDLSWREILSALSTGEEGVANTVVWRLRMPRILAAVVTGWALGLSGLGTQSLLKNPLASPFTLGISQGAAFGAALAIVLVGVGGAQGTAAAGIPAGSGMLRNVYSVSLFALGGSLSATAVILRLAVFRRLSPESVILAGVALSSLFVSGTILIQYFASDVEIASVVFWTFGDVSRSTWREIARMSAVCAGATAFFLRHRWNLNALLAGEDAARGLGVRVEALRLSGMLVASLAAAVVTAFHGVVAFLGLLAPHIGRRIVGSDHRLLVPASCLVGGLLLLGADTLGRCLAGSGSLPVGVFTSFLGAPLFLFLLIRGRRP